MSHTQVQRRWSTQSSVTRIATSICFAAAFMVAFYFLVNHGPTLVDAHALLFRVFESDGQARAAIADFAIRFSLAMQVVLALACAYVGKKLTGAEKKKHSVLWFLWLVHPLVLVIAALVMALALYSPRELIGLNSPNGCLFAYMVLFGVVSLAAAVIPPCKADERKLDNPMFALAMGKLLLLPAFALFVPTKLTLTLVLGSYLLDYLLYSVGEKIRETSPY